MKLMQKLENRKKKRRNLMKPKPGSLKKSLESIKM
jgi:hypothetical protein